MKSAIVLLMTVGVLHGQQSYGAPSSPAAGYDSPSYSAPSGDGGYAAPSDSYGAGGYADYYDQSGYVATQEDGGLDLSKITELLPLFIVVFAAIILAQLLSPLFLQLLGLLVGVLPMALSVKIPIIDAILAPFGYKLCPVTRRSISESFRSLSGELSMNDESMNILADFAERAIDAVSSMYESDI